MKALTLLYRAGLTPTTVASAIDQTPTSIRLYERGKRFPTRESYSRLVELAESKGMTLLARDFLDEGPKG